MCEENYDDDVKVNYLTYNVKEKKAFHGQVKTNLERYCYASGVKEGMIYHMITNWDEYNPRFWFFVINYESGRGNVYRQDMVEDPKMSFMYITPGFFVPEDEKVIFGFSSRLLKVIEFEHVQFFAVSSDPTEYCYDIFEESNWSRYVPMEAVIFFDSALVEIVEETGYGVVDVNDLEVEGVVAPFGEKTFFACEMLKNLSYMPLASTTILEGEDFSL